MFLPQWVRFTKYMKRIKILFFIETIDGGGAEKVLRNLVNNMDRNRFDITVQTVFPEDAEHLLAEGIRYRAMYARNSGLSRLRYRLEAACGLSYLLHIRDTYDIECACLECGATKIISGSTNKKAKKLAWVHCDLKKAMADPTDFAEKTRKYYQKFDKVVCVSRQGKTSFDELFSNRIDSVIVYNTIDREEVLWKAQQQPEREYGKPLVVSLGRLSEPKCYLRMLKAHRKLVEEGIVHHLLILGEGSERASLEAYIREHGLEQTVHLPGFAENPYPYLKKADLLACSSVYECFSTFITEGLILGKPIVTTDASGMRELLGESQWGLITDNEDEAFYKGMKEMLLSKERRISYGEKAKVRGEDFSTQILVGKTEEFFEELLR